MPDDFNPETGPEGSPEPPVAQEPQAEPTNLPSPSGMFPEAFEFKARWIKTAPDQPWVLDRAFCTNANQLLGIYLTSVLLTQMQAQEFQKIEEERRQTQGRKIEIARAGNLGFDPARLKGKLH